MLFYIIVIWEFTALGFEIGDKLNSRQVDATASQVLLKKDDSSKDEQRSSGLA